MLFYTDRRKRPLGYGDLGVSRGVNTEGREDSVNIWRKISRQRERSSAKALGAGAGFAARREKVVSVAGDSRVPRGEGRLYLVRIWFTE